MPGSVASLACSALFVAALAGGGCSSETLLTLGKMPPKDASIEPGETSEPSSPVDAAAIGLTSVEATSVDVSSAPVSLVDAAVGSSMSASSSMHETSSTNEDAGLPPFTFEEPELVAELFSDAKDDNPTLTSDMTEIYFSSKREEGDTNLWWARRDNVDEPFSAPQLLAEWSSAGFDTSPAVDGDGLTFWFSSVRNEDSETLDIWRVQRASRGDDWGTPELVSELNSDADDIPRPCGQGGLIMPLASRRAGDEYLTYFARRDTVDSPFHVAELVTGLAEDGTFAADAFLTADGLTLLYAKGVEDESSDLFVATRSSMDAPFTEIRPIESLNTSSDERDPWLSPDGRTLYFASDRDGTLAIYRANRR